MSKGLNYYPNGMGNWVGVAFLKGRNTVGDELTMIATMGDVVHCELVLGQGQYGVAYGSFNHGLDGGFLRSPNQHQSPEWTVLAMPVRDAKAVMARCLDVMACNPPYNSHDLWQCCVKVMLPFESDLDCQHPHTWTSGVFCSQMCLLMLRRLAREGMINPSPNLRHMLESVNSRGCSPSTLLSIMSPACAVAM